MARLSVRPPRFLDLDIENRPLSYLGQDFTTSEITAIAWSFGRGIEVRCLGEYTPNHLLDSFLGAYHLADIVTGHNLLRHDLPILNGACLELGLGPMEPKLVCDTYAHLRRRQGISASQASLAQTLGIRTRKQGMSQPDWREANRLSAEGIEKTRKRVIGDVRQHMALRKRLVELDWLKPPRLWTP